MKKTQSKYKKILLAWKVMMLTMNFNQQCFSSDSKRNPYMPKPNPSERIQSQPC